jgi:hypothetical protein
MAPVVYELEGGLMVRYELDEADERERRALYPTVEGGRYLASLLDSAGDADKLIARLSRVGRQAVRTYQGGLGEFVKLGAELDLIVPAIADDGEPIFRAVNFDTERSSEELELLSRPVEIVTEIEEIEGLLYEQNSLRLGFGIQVSESNHVTGEYDLRVADKLGAAWDKRVWARIEREGPKEEWMPRAGRSRRVLVDVEVLAEGESRLNPQGARAAA